MEMRLPELYRKTPRESPAIIRGLSNHESSDRMKVRVAIFIGGIRPLPVSGRPTGMYKTPLAHAVELGREGFAGDEQADRRVHGGPEKAVHLYPARHYRRLAEAFPEAAGLLVAGSMGENLSVEDIDERDVRIGDVWRLGTAHLQVCQQRNPCWKIDERYGCAGMAEFIAKQRITGWYWRVLQPGRVAPGDMLERLEAAVQAPTLQEAMALWDEHRPSLAALERLANVPGISRRWKDKIEQRLAYLEKETSPIRSD